ncbi:hypothetical protein GCK72_004863 [Caenorhabditis remanei]|uniref:RING-type domain-containing protein n=2 Tax=Caenorhabditis remanei TaxID=31234 RepID=A0A6A5HFE7_CAERE|nr:hypothetical protein GCK72_004863 [Caenorhabditis remanei]KAF1764912.1 hypothetical protein GCK72_004863 [Caenorhabditis remanei]
MTEKQEITFDCKICNDDFDDETPDLIPRILTNCGHTICDKCANQMLIKSRIICPFDRKVTVLVGDHASGLPKNFFLVGLIQERKKLTEYTEYVPKPGDFERKKETCIENPCFQNYKHKAVFFCEQCDEDFCESCFISLHRPKTFATHKKTLITEKPLKLPQCPEHPYNIADLWCKDSNCKVVEKRMCHTCLLAGEHKSHEYELLRDRIRSNVEKLKTEIKKSKEHIETYKAKKRRLENCMETYNEKNPLYLELVQMISNQFEVKKVNALEQLRLFSLRRQKWFLKDIDFTKDKIEGFENTISEAVKKLRKNLHEVANLNLPEKLPTFDLLELKDFHYSLTKEMELTISIKGNKIL